MWVAKFKLQDNNDIYSPPCVKHNVEFFASPYTQFTKKKQINLLLGGTISGSEKGKERFITDLQRDARVKHIERQHDFLIVHAQHPSSRETEAEIKIFYNPEIIQVRPVHIASDGWEYWEVASLDRQPLNTLVKAAVESYHGKLFSLRQEKLKGVASLTLTPSLTDKQLEALKLAITEGYYAYPRSLTLPKLARMVKRSYSTFQEHLRKGESKIVEHFLKYR